MFPFFSSRDSGLAVLHSFITREHERLGLVELPGRIVGRGEAVAGRECVGVVGAELRHLYLEHFFGDRECLVRPTRRWSWNRFAELVRRAVEHLQQSHLVLDGVILGLGLREDVLRQELVDRFRLGSLIPRGRLSRAATRSRSWAVRDSADFARLASANASLSATVAPTACQVLTAAAVASNAANAAAVTSAARCLRAYFRSR